MKEILKLGMFWFCIITWAVSGVLSIFYGWAPIIAGGFLTLIWCFAGCFELTNLLLEKRRNLYK